MSSHLIKQIQEFNNLLVLCPCCSEVVKLSELKIYYKGKGLRNWYDDLISVDRGLRRKEDRFESRREDLRAEAIEKGQRYLWRYLCKADAILPRLRYFPQDIKSVFWPIDFIVFDGMSRKDAIRKIVFMDRTPESKIKENIHTSLKSAIRKGNYEWITVTLNNEGKLIPSWSYYSFPRSPDMRKRDQSVSIRLTSRQRELLLKLKRQECNDFCPVKMDCHVCETRKEGLTLCKDLFVRIGRQDDTLSLSTNILKVLVYLLELYAKQSMKLKEKAELTKLRQKLTNAIGR